MVKRTHPIEDNPLVQAALDEGAIMDKIAEEAPDEKSFSDVTGGGQFYPELPKVKLADILGKTFVMRDAVIIENYEGKWGIHDFAIMLLVNHETGEEFTCACSGQVILKKVRIALEKEALPLLATITRTQRYYDIQ